MTILLSCTIAVVVARVTRPAAAAAVCVYLIVSNNNKNSTPNHFVISYLVIRWYPVVRIADSERAEP